MGLTREMWCCAGLRLSRVDINTWQTSIKDQCIIIVLLLRPHLEYYRQYENFVYFQVSNGVVYLDYEDSTSSWSSVLVSMIVLDSSLLFDDVLFCLRCFSGVPAWRLMEEYSITVGFSPILYC